MFRQFGLLLISAVTFLSVSCNNDGKNKSDENEIIETKVEIPIVKRAEKRELTPAEKERANSVMSRLILIPESNKFARYAVTANLANFLADEKGPFLVFAPSDSVIQALPLEKRKFYSNQENLSKLQDILKSHIVKTDSNYTDLLQSIKKNGNVKLKTLEGITLSITQSEDKIIITDGKGGKANIEKSDLEASNGQVFVINGILNMH